MRGPKTTLDNRNLATVGRKILEAMRFHLRPQKSCREEERFFFFSNEEVEVEVVSSGDFGFWIFTGKEAKTTNCLRERDGLYRGPLPKAKSKSLKLASHEMKNAKVPPRCKL
ncbi:hypothetical protein SESBI_38878 [Sesbania bispinosa]|nr:hypothetical protein SESBI_38878 [Sesbania bispinosa]